MTPAEMRHIYGRHWAAKEAAMITLTSLQFSRQMPTEPGWYWWRRNDYPDSIFKLTAIDLPIPEWSQCQGTQFAGPIPLPRDAEPEGCEP